ncbi:MAG: zinc ribbon domain-containing protein [Promethearchaeota archaeon]
MTSISRNSQKKGLLRIWVLLFILITSLSVILSLLIDPFWWILLPLSFSFLIILLLMSRYFWLEKKYCPRCNTPTGKYSEYCRNCGLRLFFKCISCGKYMRVGSQFCDNCNAELGHTEEEKEIFKYPKVEKGTPLPEIPNFCTTCGAEVKHTGITRFCEECGAKLK